VNHVQQSKNVFEKFITTVTSHRLLDVGDKVIVAVSGGADSVALLHLLLTIRRQYSLELVVAHLNHNLRGVESDGDEDFVRSLATERRLSFISEKISDEQARLRFKGTEEWARNRRHAFLRHCLQESRAQKIALGHTRDDQAETFLMRLIRGSGTQGLAAMRPMTNKVIRPLLDLEHSDVVQYLTSEGSQWREDSSNKNIQYLRNRLRFGLVPELQKEYNPRIVRTLSTTAEILGEDREALEYCLEGLLQREALFEPEKVLWRIEMLASLPQGLQKNLLRLSIGRVTGAAVGPGSKLVSAVLSLLQKGKTGKRIKTKAFQCTRSRELLVLEGLKND